MGTPLPVKDYGYMLNVFRRIVESEVEVARASLHPNQFIISYLDELLARLDEDLAAGIDQKWLWEFRVSIIMLAATAAMADATSALSRHLIDTANARKALVDKIYSLLRMMVSIEHNGTTTTTHALGQPAPDGATAAPGSGPDGAGIDTELQPAVS